MLNVPRLEDKKRLAQVKEKIKQSETLLDGV